MFSVVLDDEKNGTFKNSEDVAFYRYVKHFEVRNLYFYAANGDGADLVCPA